MHYYEYTGEQARKFPDFATPRTGGVVEPGDIVAVDVSLKDHPEFATAKKADHSAFLAALESATSTGEAATISGESTPDT